MSQPPIRNVSFNIILNASALLSPLTCLPSLVLTGRYGGVRGKWELERVHCALDTKHSVTLQHLGDKSLFANLWDSHQTPFWGHWLPSGKAPSPASPKERPQHLQADSQVERLAQAALLKDQTWHLSRSSTEPLRNQCGSVFHAATSLSAQTGRGLADQHEQGVPRAGLCGRLLCPCISCVVFDLCCVVEGSCHSD